MTPLNPAVLGLIDLLGRDRVRFDDETRRSHGRDWTRFFDPNPSAVVFPRSKTDVVAAVRWAREHRIALVPSGGRTGLSGGAVAKDGEVVISFDRMNRIGEFDPVGRTIEVESGVITETLQGHVAERGYLFPVDFASRGSSQIGGNVATNAGGIKVLRYGMMRDWVAGLEVVTGASECLQLNRGLVKNATGYDLRHLFIGSEGTLGLITRVVLRLCARPGERSVLLLALPRLEDVMTTFHAFQDTYVLAAFEFLSGPCLSLVEAQGHVASPLATRAPYYVLAEIDRQEGIESSMHERLLESLVQRGHVIDGVISSTSAQAHELWRLREDISEAASRRTPYKNDVAVTIRDVPRFVDQLAELLAEHYPDLQVLWFGHIGDGNVHINILKPVGLETEAFYRRCQRIDELIYGVVERFGGSVSAEHGVGLIKKAFLHRSRSLPEIEMMRGIKKIFDPDGIMNPGKIFD